MPEPIQQRPGPLLVRKDLDPFTKGEITCNDCRALAVAFGQDVKEQLATSTFEPHVQGGVVHGGEFCSVAVP